MSIALLAPRPTPLRLVPMRQRLLATQERANAMTDGMSFCLLFCGLLLAYKKNKPVSDYVQMMGLPAVYSQIAQ